MTTPQRLSSFITTRPVAILMVFLAAVVFGLLSIQRLPVQLMPELTYPTLTVRTEYPGAAPEEVEENVTRLVEEAVGVVGGLVRLSSISRAELSDVTLEFTWDTEMSEAWQEVNDFANSGANDAHYVLNRAAGEVRFGDGINGRRPAALARWATTARWCQGS